MVERERECVLRQGEASLDGGSGIVASGVWSEGDDRVYREIRR